MASQFAVKETRGNLSSFRITFAFLLSLALGLWSLIAHAEARPVQAHILIDAATGKVLASSNADTLTYPASLTKMMTLYLLFEALEIGRVKPTDTIVFSKNAAGKSATNLNVKGGDSITVETAILALVVRSANDVATAVAEHLGGTESGFARLMTNKAQMLGMSRTTFRNANGLPDPKQKSTARDMATLSMALIRDFPQYYDYFKRTSFKYRGVTYAGHNKLLKTFKGYDGIKTGYIRASGFNLASSAERDGRRLVVVVMGGTSPSMRDRKVADLLTTGFKTKGGSGPVLVAKAPDAIAEPQAKPFVPAPAESAQPVSVVEDVIANILVKPAEADVLAEADVAMTGVRLAGVKSLAPMLKPGTGTATVASAPDTQATTVVWKPEGNYGIQVGAYSKYNAAQKAAQTAAKAEAALLSDARIIIDTQKMNSGGKVYRARVAGLTKADAQTACKNLKAKDTDCLVLKISSALAMGN